MKKLFFLTGLLALMSTLTLKAQVTIGENVAPDKNAVLELRSNGNLGLLLPRVVLTDTLSAAPLTEPVSAGMMVYNTTASEDGKVVEGVYIYDSRRWWKASTVESSPAGPWQISGTTDRATANNEDIYQMGQVTIGSADAVEPTAMLNIIATDKGVLFPRIPLTSITDATTVPNPATGLLVFSTGTGGLEYSGYVFWDGYEWKSLTSGSLAPGTIGSITCNGISLTPPVYHAGEPFEGTMIVPYTGSNGGTYPDQTLGPVNGLTATLVAGNFNAGAGNLAYAITGTPTVTTPETTTFAIEIGGKTCEAVIGAGDGIAPGDLIFYTTPEIPANVGGGDNNTGNIPANWMSYYVDDLPVIGGKLRLDGYFSDPSTGIAGTVSFNPRLVNITDENVKIWFSAMTTIDRFNGANIVLQPEAWLNLDNGLYFSPQPNRTMTTPITTPYVSGAGNNSEVLTLDLQLDNKWYRIYYYPIVDNKDQITPAGMVRKVYLSIQRLY